MATTKAMSIPKNRGPGRLIEPFQHPAPKLEMAPPDMQPWKMTPPSLSPLHMSPPNMLLPNFSPIQDHMPLPTLSASTFIPPQSFLTHRSGEPISVVRFSRLDPWLLCVGTCAADPDSVTGSEGQSLVTIYKAQDVEREVRGDREIVAGPSNPVRLKIRPTLQEMASISVPAAVLDLQFSPHDPEVLAVALSNGTVAVYRVRRGSYRARHLSTQTLARDTPIHHVLFSPTNGQQAAAGLANGTTLVLEVSRDHTTWRTVSTIPADGSRVHRIAFSVDGRRLYTATADGTLTSYATSNPRSPRQRWSDSSTHTKGGITALLPWPAPAAGDIGHKRRALLTGSRDGRFRVLDMSLGNRPPLTTQTLELQGTPWRLAPLPALPALDEVKALGAGVFSAAAHPDVELEREHVGVLACAAKGAARVLIHKQKFEDVFLPKRDGSDIVDWKTQDGVKMDAEGREKQYWWYDLADIEEHDGEHVWAGDAVAMIDYDPLFRDGGDQRLRRGWRLCSADRSGGIIFWQVYVE